MKEETLDPEDWEELRKLAHQMVDDMLEWQQTLRARPVWQPVPNEVKAKFKRSLPLEAQNIKEVYKDFLTNVLPFPNGNQHPRFWGWVHGTSAPFGMLAEMLAAGMNPNAGFGEQSAVYVEKQVIDWCKEILGFPSEASGILVSGCTMANLTGLTVARNTKAGFNVRQRGLQHSNAKLVLYGSSETHTSIQKAIEVLGLGSESLRRIPVNSDFQIDLAALKSAIAEDRAKGLAPFCVVGNAGTVNTGATDNLNELADVCEAEGLWFHIDGAFGALAALSPQYRRIVKGMERADSLAFDLHKWMSMPYEAGCVLIAHQDKHHQSFSTAGAYLLPLSRGVASGIWFSEYGVQLSRGFRALKVWLSIKENGINKYRRLIEQNISQAAYLASLIEASADLELLAPVPLNIVCFRFIKRDLAEDHLTELNKEILLRLQESGIAIPTYTTINGKFAIRCSVTNHRSRREDFDLLIDNVITIGKEILG
ncbi:MAG TPA: aminotransferase class I/II-fold pyridoxal phosphate-dependent enzyme [Pyrinomonadaceae bacterium]|jgi:glutamate/tyrosine decarboxylase-like PLP-dependent enzyme|nr:aminotransferase class I/II-fold pyridoxal phosphate-dependent enzyme [Pyrinomonadaceae bacterium]